MKKREFMAQIPYGTRDYLPGEARKKRIIENSLTNLFLAWGYQEVVTPTYEYLETFQAGAGCEGLPETIKFFDKNNLTLALRSDMTTPLARLTASRLRGEKFPLRQCYLANVFRYEQAQAGRQCEFFQGGVELLGIPYAGGDAEVIALAIQSMKEAGLSVFQFSLGQVDFIHGIMQEAGIDDECQTKIKHYMITRNIVGLESLLASTELTKPEQEMIRMIPQLYGKQEILERAAKVVSNTKSRQALDNLQEIYDLLAAYDVEQYISFDLGLIRDFDYYTGMVFEGYTPGLGFPVCGGGRYDNLLAAFGFDCPATGFAVGIDRLLLAFERQGIQFNNNKESVYVSWQEGNLMQAIMETMNLRDQGLIVELSLQPESKIQAQQTCDQKQCTKLIYLD